MSWKAADGTGEVESVGELGQYDSLSLSPDGTRVAYERWDTPDGRIAIWIHDLARNVNSPFARRNDGAPVWSPDGQAIAFGSIRRGSGDLYRMAARGGDTEELLLESEDFLLPSGWSADGRFLVFVNISSSDVGILLVSAPGEAKLLLQSEFVEKDGRPSADGQWLAYTSNESGAWEVPGCNPFPTARTGCRCLPGVVLTRNGARMGKSSSTSPRIVDSCRSSSTASPLTIRAHRRRCSARAS